VSKKCPSRIVGIARGCFSQRAGSRIRTDDLLITNQLLYQLSYAGVLHMKAVFSALIKSSS
jgi:hypothetical protein